MVRKLCLQSGFKVRRVRLSGRDITVVLALTSPSLSASPALATVERDHDADAEGAAVGLSSGEFREATWRELPLPEHFGPQPLGVGALTSRGDE